MTTYLILDLAVLLVLLLFAALGARRGLILSLCGLAALLVAVLGASFTAAPSPPWWPTPWSPGSLPAIEAQLNESLQEQAQEGGRRPHARGRAPGRCAERPAGHGLL